MKKTGILTWHYYQNFGSALQAYALQRAIEKLGYKPYIINFRNPSFFDNKIYNFIQYIVGKTFGKLPFHRFERRKYPFVLFHRDFFRQTKLALDKISLEKLCRKFDTIIVGSDQIWAPNVLDAAYLLDFADSEKTKKISYAASIGLNDIPEDKRLCYKTCLSDFKAVSVREQEGAELLDNLFGIDAEVVLDPTLLNTAEDYKKIEAPIKGIKKPFAFCYFLNAENTYGEKIKQYSEEHNVTLCGVSAKNDDRDIMTFIDYIGPREFLWLVRNAETVFTDSYHGTVFSMLFHKEFYLFERFKNDDPICQNSRIRQLYRTFGIQSRVFDGNKNFVDYEQFDYSIFEEKLKTERDASVEYLRKSLSL